MNPASERPNGPTQGEFSNSWEPRPVAAHAVAFAVPGVPILISIASGRVAARLFPRPTGFAWLGWVPKVRSCTIFNGKKE